MSYEKLEKITKIYKRLICFIYPHYCHYCEGRSSLESLYCPLCTRVLKEKSPFSQQKFHQGNISSITTLFPFDPPIQHIIHNLKYDNLLKPAQELILLGTPPELSSSIDIIIPIPLHWLREIKRGYNQAMELSRSVAKVTGKPIKKAVKRIRYTTTQTQKNRAERKQNMDSVFRINPNISVKEQRILLVDDVYTTGATTKSCAQILLEAGAKEVHILTIAKA